MAEAQRFTSKYPGLAIFSYGFRPFFLGASIFAGIAVPLWAFIISGDLGPIGHYPARDWHVHEMMFGFLPAVITGFLLTAISNWTDRPPVRGGPLMYLFALWVSGRIAMATPWANTLVSAILDGMFLLAVAVVVWREISAGQVWERAPIGFLISLYALANIWFHVLLLGEQPTDLPERIALGLVLLLLAIIGGRITPSFTQDFLADQGMSDQPVSFSPIDGLSIILVGVAAVAWILHPQAVLTGWILVMAGFANLIRLIRWYGWLTWREPLVLILHVGYGWLVFSLFIVGGAILGVGVPAVEAIHTITTGAVGVMTLAVMTRASLGHTGRAKHAGAMTVLIYLLINLGAILRIWGSASEESNILMLSLAAACWSGAYMVFVVVYGPMLLRPSLEE